MKPCPFCGSKLTPRSIEGIAAHVCHRLRCLGYEQTVPTVFVWDKGLKRRRDLERLLAVELAREQKIEA